jgi:glucose-1-phosphate cytidylyltransferase
LARYSPDCGREANPMKAVILAGGFGTRLSEEAQLKPKPMVEIGDKPILWHIMNIFSTHGVQEFVVALGYKPEFVKNYFLNSAISCSTARCWTTSRAMKPFENTIRSSDSLVKDN